MVSMTCPGFIQSIQQQETGGKTHSKRVGSRREWSTWWGACSELYVGLQMWVYIVCTWILIWEIQSFDCMHIVRSLLRQLLPNYDFVLALLFLT